MLNEICTVDHFLLNTERRKHKLHFLMLTSLLIQLEIIRETYWKAVAYLSWVYKFYKPVWFWFSFLSDSENEYEAKENKKVKLVSNNWTKNKF